MKSISGTICQGSDVFLFLFTYLYIYIYIYIIIFLLLSAEARVAVVSTLVAKLVIPLPNIELGMIKNILLSVLEFIISNTNYNDFLYSLFCYKWVTFLKKLWHFDKLGFLLSKQNIVVCRN